MIKRRFYKLEHGDRNDAPSESSSSSSSSFSDPDSEAEATGEEFEAGGDGISAPAHPGEDAEACSTSSGYESEDSSANEVDIDSSGLPINDDAESGDELPINADNRLSSKRGSRFFDKQPNMEENELLSSDFPACVLKCKAVYKCRICPRIVCLNEETLRAHLNSKRHSRSEKLLNEGRLKATLNSDGEIDNEDPSTREDVEISAAPQDKRQTEKGGRQRQHCRRQSKKLKKKKVEDDSGVAKTREIKEKKPAKKRRKQEKK